MADLEKVDKYEILDKIGEGGGGVVYRARDPHLKREVAIKLCLIQDPELAKRLAREAEIAAGLQHPNIVTVFDFGFLGDRPYLVQELLSGEDLIEVIRRRDPMPQAKRLDCLRQVASALAFAHSEGVIHRDIKPSNIRLEENHHVKILDFGIARLIDASSKLTRAGTTLGTAGYLSPEQIKGIEVDSRADIFCFGILAYELLTYHRPFEADQMSELFRKVLEEDAPPLRDLYPEIPEAIERWVAKCLKRDRDERWSSFDDLIPEIEASYAAVDGDTGSYEVQSQAGADDSDPPRVRDSEPAPLTAETTVILPTDMPDSGGGKAGSLGRAAHQSLFNRKWLLSLAAIASLALLIWLWSIAR